VSDLRDRLQTTLGSAYTLERELGGGGMSRVFVADETALGRKVVVKVLPPELAAGVSVERFNREIQVAARLQHPHIVPVLSAGETEGLPYYTMPFVDGSSLRARLARGPLAISEATGILKEVARALAYAHEHGVVHRDIKPDNVLLTGGSAVVTDFGIAKALSASRMDTGGSATLTAMGTSLGTPAYMAPEQAAGDPTTDHRADLYAFGCMAYELLSGEQPFQGRTPHKLMAAHMGEKPQHVAERRPDTPPALAVLVMQCLEKEPDHRPQGAAEVARVLESVTSSGTSPTMPGVLLAGRGMLMKALLVYAGAFVVVAVLAKAAIVGIGLPDWVYPGALIVMALGLPAILFTAWVHRVTRRTLTATPSVTPGGSAAPQGTMATLAMKAAPHVSWRRTTMGGVGAVGGLILLVGAWMVMRALGIGPAASLMAAGKLGERERVILADFGGEVDSSLRFTVTEALRSDLSQSQSLDVMPANAVRETLRRMQRPASSAVDFALAREIATREGIKAIIEGQVLSAGDRYLLSVRLLAAQTSEQLGTFSETADDLNDIIPAISRLTKKIRTRTGESLRAIQSAPALDKVTTPSFEALEKYVSAVRMIETDGDLQRSLDLLEEAVALDTGFAMAYRKLAVELNNRGLQAERIEAAIQKAYDHRERLGESERQLTIAAYFSYGPAPDESRVLEAYESIIARDPTNTTALNNAAVYLGNRRNFARAESLAMRAIGIRPNVLVYHQNVIGMRVALGRLEDAAVALQKAAVVIPGSPGVAMMSGWLAIEERRLDDAAGTFDSIRIARPGDLLVQRETSAALSQLALTQGRLRESADARRRAVAPARQLGTEGFALNAQLREAAVEILFRADTVRAQRIIDRALSEFPLVEMRADTRPYLLLATLYGLVGRPDGVRAMQAGYDSARSRMDPTWFAAGQHGLRAALAMAEQKYDVAAREYRAADYGPCVLCILPDLARAYDLAGNADSAIAVFSRYVNGHGRDSDSDAFFLAGSHRRLGELYDARGDREQAVSHYSRFVDLWKNADPELQSLVRQARERVAALQRGG
jgi:tetratricopeptide (TPR) repeat protein/tRNA A-37 threonylcarbamoyl transferase component Bud32